MGSDKFDKLLQGTGGGRRKGKRVMAVFKQITTFAAIGLLTAQPCLAADLLSTDVSRQSGSFAGAYIRVPFGLSTRNDGEARAGLRFGATHVLRDAARSGGERRFDASLVDVGIFRSGRPSLMLAGRQLVAEQGRISFQSGDEERKGGIPTWAIVAGGLLLTAGVGYLILLEQLDCDRDEECN